MKKEPDVMSFDHALNFFKAPYKVLRGKENNWIINVGTDGLHYSFKKTEDALKAEELANLGYRRGYADAITTEMERNKSAS